MKRYEEPEFNLYVFQMEDVIASSDPFGGVDGDGNTGGDGGIRQ